MSGYSPLEILTTVAALAGGVAVSLLAIRKAYGRSVLRLMRSKSVPPDAAVLPSASNRSPRAASLTVQLLPANASPDVARLTKAASRVRGRRTLAIAISFGVVGLLQGLVFLTVIEPGRLRLQGIVAAALIYASPSLLIWLVARTVSQGQPSELGLWAGLAIGLISGGGVLVSLQSLGAVRIATAALALAVAVLVGYLVLVVCAALLRAAQALGRFSSDSIAATLSCIGASAFGLIPALMDGRVAGWLYPMAALAFPPVLTGIVALTGSRAESVGFAPPRLLLLRTFGYAKRSNRLLRRLAGVWLALGPIDMIAGPDLSASVVTLDKVNAWLTGRLRSQFIAGATDFARVTTSAITRFRDGGYPVAEFSCLDSSWRETVTSLACRADAVVMDLRNFRRQNTGCIFEVSTLVATVVPERVVFLVDASTDLPALDDILRHGFRARVYRLERDDSASLDTAIWAALGTLGEQSGPRLPAVEPAIHTGIVS